MVRHGLFRRRIWLLLGLMLARTAAGAGTQLTGTVEGTVRDTTGGVLPGTTIELINPATGKSLSRETGDGGRYVFESVAPGPYFLQASFKGFKTVRKSVDVAFNSTSRIDFILSVSPVAEQVVVTGSATARERERADLSLHVEARILSDLPDLAHDITQRIELMPGVRLEAGGTAGGSRVVDLSGNYALGNGTRRGQGIFYVDGAENMGTWRHQALQMPHPDSIQEMQIIASGASAEFGKEPGVRIHAVIRSGTDDFHGSAFFAVHLTGLNANTWSANRNGASRPADLQKWLGATLGGPVLRKRTFFFASFHHFYDNESAQVANVRMPTPAMINGDFSAIPNFTIKAIDPATGKAIGKIIPARLISPIAATMAARFPTIAQYSNDPALGRFFWQYQRPVFNNMWIAKIDHQLTPHQQLSGSYLATDGGQTLPGNLSGSANQVPGWGGDTETGARQHTVSIRHLWAATSNLVLENRAALARQTSRRGRTGPVEDLAALGGIWPAVTPGISRSLPTLFLSGGPTARGGPSLLVLQQNFRLLNTTDWLRGKHNLKFGVELQSSLYQRGVNHDDGQFRFTGAYANTGAPLDGPWPSLSTPSGDNQFALAWADFLLGRVRTFQATGAARNSFHGWSYYLFFQDQFKISRTIMVMSGLRYELHGVQTSDGLLAGYVAGHRSDRFPQAPVGIAFAGDSGIEDGMRAPDRNNLAPRLGFAWDTYGNGKTIVRAGAGLYYAYPPFSVIEQLGAIVAAPTHAGANASLRDPWGTAHANSGDARLQYPGGMPGFDPDPATRTWQPSDITGFSPDARTPYQWQFNAGLLRQITGGLTIQAGYVGNRSAKAWSVRDQNLALWQENASIGNLDARRLNQVWHGINLMATDVNERYDAAELTATLSRRGTYIRATYTLRRYLTTGRSEGQEVGISNSPAEWAGNPRDIRADMASVVPRQQLRIFFNTQLPGLFKGTWMKYALNGWQLSGSFSWHDGDRLNVILGPDYNYDGFGGDRPDQVGPVRYPRQPQGSGLIWIDRSAFATPPLPAAESPYPFGNLPRNAVRGPQRLFLSAAIMKSLVVRDRYRLLLRLDASNLLNHPNWSNPVMDLSKSNFGLIQTKDGGGRVMQLQAKFVF